MTNSARRSRNMCKHSKPLKPLKPKLRYRSETLPRIMIDNCSTGSLFCVIQLEPTRDLTGNAAPFRTIKNHYIVSAHGGSKRTGMAAFKLSYNYTVLHLDAPVVECINAPIITVPPLRLSAAFALFPRCIAWPAPPPRSC